MSSHNVKSIKQGAILVANNLRTGLTVYLTEKNSWSEELQDAWIIRNDAEADQAKTFGAESSDANEVMDPYLVDTTQEGHPTHIREHLRTTGPSVCYQSSVHQAS